MHESFTGTCGIAIAPVALGSQLPKKRKTKDNRTKKMESNMSARRTNGNTIKEWLPGFKGAGYTPGDAAMPSPSGKGVAERSSSEVDIGDYDSETSHIGDEWPREHNETAAMCDVDEDGTEGSQGGHESTHAQANDTIQSKVGHNWPNPPKNSGQGVAEPFEGNRWSDGGTLSGGRGPGSDTWTNEEGPGMPSDGPITGTSGPQLGQPTNESWSPNRMAQMLGGDVDVQALFDSYAKSASAICLEDFQQLCEAHGADLDLDHTSLMRLMAENKEFVFHEASDSDGPYWIGEEMAECDTKPKKKQKRKLNEWQVRSPEDEAGMYDNPLETAHIEDYNDSAMNRGDETYSANEMDDSHHPLGMAAGMECPGCGYTGQEAECPECGSEMIDQIGEGAVDSDPTAIPGMVPDDAEEGPMGSVGVDEEFPGEEGNEYDPLGGPRGPMQNPMSGGPRGPAPMPGQRPMPGGPRMESKSRTTVTGPQIIEGLKRFMTSVRSMIENNPQARRSDLAEALNRSWQLHAGSVDATTCPRSVQQTLNGLMTKFPGFNPIAENDHSMDKPEGTIIGGTSGGGPKINLPKQPTEMKTHGDKSLLGKSQTNTLDGTPTIKGTGKGMNVGESIQTNISRLTRHVKQQLQESLRSVSKELRSGNYKLQFATVVSEAKALPDFIKDKMKDKKGAKGKGAKGKDVKKKTKTKPKDNLAEALADVEELLQLHNPKDLSFEATFLGPQGQIALKQDIPLFTIMPRGPMVSEGKALFRFQRHAEEFADQLALEGVTSRIAPHNWGSAVQAKTNYAVAARAFATISENKK